MGKQATATLGRVWLARGKLEPGELGRWSLMACQNSCAESRLPFLLPKGWKNRQDYSPCNMVNRCLPHTAEVSWPSRNVQVAEVSCEQWGKEAGAMPCYHSRRGNKIQFCTTHQELRSVQDLTMPEHVIQEAISAR